MSDLFGAAYRGDPSIPHVSEDFFKLVLVSANAALLCVSMPGRIFGSEVRPRKFNPDYIKAVCEEARQRREVLAGKKVTQLMARPTETNHSHERMWFNEKQARRWAVDRMGPKYPAS